MYVTVLDDSNRFQKSFLLLLLAFVSILFFTMIRQFVMTILLAAIFSGLMTPLYRRLVTLLRGRKIAASAITLLTVVLTIIIPLMLLLTIVVTQAVRISAGAGPWIQAQIQNPDLLVQKLQTLPGFDAIEPYRHQILTRLGEGAAGVGGFVVGGLSAATKGTVVFFFHFFLFLYAMFFFLMDGAKMLRRVLYYMPLPHETESVLVSKFVSVTRATIKGTIVIGLMQGSLAAVALGLAGIRDAVFWGAIMTVLSIIPGIGTSLVWVPAAIYLAVTGHVTAAIIVSVWCALVVGSVDNLVRPRLVGKDTQMHDLLILFSTLGGLLFFGVTGIIIGPIIAALFVSVWDLYGVVFKDVRPEVGDIGEKNGC
ncbi:MAG: AI-2E family transporter [Candidatus Krumholzibacteriota bacterium]|nr:AI-2E family transporter [Candidatus Krumholzibacteriota bacterium]